MIIDYDNKYDEDIKDLLVELQEYISAIDKEGYNILGDNYREQCFIENMEEINKYNGKIFLLLNENKVIGLVIGLVNNDEIENYDFKAPKRGRITELIVSKDARGKGYGKTLLNAMEEYLKSIGCKDILLGVFGYNEKAINFYLKNNYHTRLLDMIKTNI